jgi:glyoxylase-like metal-dependent hydrolase (beta-lactamase superfamily II)
MSSAPRFIDVQFQGRRRVIATAVLETSDGVALVDPGPSSSLETMLGGLAEIGVRLDDVRALLLTHIHFDHAGGAGTLVRRSPGLRVFVHERGARHMIDPSRLYESAKRLYGDQMSSLWGDMDPVPEQNVTVLGDGHHIDIGGLHLDVAYTPGHASHHVSYFDRTSGVAYVGDTAGIRIGLIDYNIPPTPPPDIDVEAWELSIARIRAWNPRMLFLTHFGPVPDVEPHFERFLSQLRLNTERAERLMQEPTEEDERARRFAILLEQEIGRLPEADAASYRQGIRFEHCWLGLARYWRKKLGVTV